MKRFSPAPDPQICGGCRHFEMVGSTDPAAPLWGVCRRRAPIVTPLPNGEGHVRGWPQVYAVDACGEFEPRHALLAPLRANPPGPPPSARPGSAADLPLTAHAL